MADRITIGIAGGTGSGKTTITRRILREFGGNVSVLYHDNYYKRHDDMTYEERSKLNYDHPNAFDTPLFVEHLRALRAGQTIKSPVYDYKVHNRSDRTQTIHPAKVFASKGILLLGNESQTVGPEDAPMEVHLVLLGAGVVLLEGIRLAEVEEGRYFLCAAPLNLSGADGSPCRAFLIADER